MIGRIHLVELKRHESEDRGVTEEPGEPQEASTQADAGVRVQPASDFAGEPDGLERLWTPHRMAYIDGNDDRKEKGDEAAGHVCPFCAAPRKSDSDGLIVFRGETAYVVLNLFPYNPGHLLVCPYRHVPMYTDVTEEEREEIGLLTAQAMEVLKASMAPDGFNLGVNQGDVAGAGIAEHLHQHVVPRWSGDANFFPIIARTKAMPELLEETRENLATKWIELYGEGE